MSEKMRRSLFQLAIGLITLGAIINLGCSCDDDKGSDHKEVEADISMRTRDLPKAYLPGIVLRWHDFESGNTSLKDKDLDFMRTYLGQDALIIGIRLPKAQGATDPGSLYGTNHDYFIRWDQPNPTPAASGQNRSALASVSITIDLQSDAQNAQKISQMFPPPEGTQWQALVPTNEDWLNQIPQGDTSFSNIWGSLHYELDFHGDDFCQGCEVVMTYCTPNRYNLGQQLALRKFGFTPRQNQTDLLCRQPYSTYITITDNTGAVIPGPFVAAFGFWGGKDEATITNPNTVMLYTLSHTGSTPQTFNLSTIQSEQGWSYNWYDTEGNPITQIVVDPLPVPIWNPIDPNLWVITNNLPDCTRQTDRITLTATHVGDPAFTAQTNTTIQVMPDPARCAIADVGITKSADPTTITAGDWVTYTLTITNYENFAVNTTIEDTFSSAAAIADDNLPAGCSRTGATVTCNADDIPANSSVQIEYSIQVATNFSGTLTNQARVEPDGGVTDQQFYDNISLPVDVTVNAGEGPQNKIFLPILQRH